MAGKWYAKNVRVFWLEAGENIDCEAALDLSYGTSSVIAFKTDDNSFEQMEYSFNIDNMNEFVDKVYQADGLYASN